MRRGIGRGQGRGGERAVSRSPAFIHPASSASGCRGFVSRNLAAALKILLCGSRLNSAVNLLFKYGAAGAIKPEPGPNPEVTPSYSLIPKSQEAHIFLSFFFMTKHSLSPDSLLNQTLSLWAPSFLCDSPAHLHVMDARQMHDGRCPRARANVLGSRKTPRFIRCIASGAVMPPCRMSS